MDIKSLSLTVLILLFSVTSSYTQREACDPGHNCKPPDCRCPNDPNPPGNIKPSDTPQIIPISFQYAVNWGNYETYADVFVGLTNPNGCPVTGTFFVQAEDSTVADIQKLAGNGHEMGLTSCDGKTPLNWIQNLKVVKEFLKQENISSYGTRAPSMLLGGDAQMYALSWNDLVYDTSCVLTDTFLWPYTNDFVESAPICSMGRNPFFDHPGIWQFPMPLLQCGNDSTVSSATLSGCSQYLKSAEDTYSFLNINFFRHYNGLRIPFQLFLDPLWFSVDYQIQGTKQFLQLVQQLKDTWLVTYSQALWYLKDPVTIANATNYGPWQCNS